MTTRPENIQEQPRAFSLDLGIEHAYGGARRAFGLPASTLLRHVFVIGQTGVGKTTFLMNLMTQLIEAGHGVGFLDPHGTAARELLDYIPPRKSRGVVYFDPADISGIGRPIGLNPLDGVRLEDHHLTASAIGEAIRALHVDSWGDRLDWILYNALRALLYSPRTTVLDVPRLLVDEGFRARIVARIQDTAVRSFWLDEFEAYDRAFRTIAVAPVQNKVGKLRAHPPLRAILGQEQSRVDLRHVLDRGQLLIANLAGIGEGSTNLLGSLLLSSLLGAAMRRDPASRHSTDGKQTGDGQEALRPFTLVLDEAHRFTTESISSVLSEARKYGLGLVLADQFLDQLTEPTRQAVFGNAATLVVFRVGAGDTTTLAMQLGSDVTPRLLADLDPFQAVVRSVARREAIGPLKITTLPFERRRYGRRKVIEQESARRFGRKPSSSQISDVQYTGAGYMGGSF